MQIQFNFVYKIFTYLSCSAPVILENISSLAFSVVNRLDIVQFSKDGKFILFLLVLIIQKYFWAVFTLDAIK